MKAALIFAGGIGSRMRSKGRPKQFLELSGKPIIIHTIENFERHPEINYIVVVCVADWIPYLEEQLYNFRITKVKKIVPGGNSGQESIWNGLNALKNVSENESDIVLIHDGVRPLITQDDITANIRCVEKYGSCITSSSARETVFISDECNAIKSITERNQTKIAKAPQSFYLADIVKAHLWAKEVKQAAYIDSCSLMYAYGNQLYWYEGSSDNIKVTTPEDFYMLRSIFESRENAQIYGIEGE
ncbi:MAG: 2-C-methyl-D-erythritol 4-phosphate cytidylyltransferase [Clostridiales bacterium]|nr:2-C-methyl-D-erythritol 4-phosphate cytidylyltransferase [Clostridiales bacterium]